MKRLTRASAFGEPTDALRAVVDRALLQKEEPMKKKSFSAVLIAAAIIALLAATALAVANRLGVLDTMPHYDKETGADATGFVISDIAQEGGDLARVKFTVQDAIYDGINLHFNIVATPKDEDVLLTDGNRMPDAIGAIPEELALDPSIEIGKVYAHLGVWCDAAGLADGKIVGKNSDTGLSSISNTVERVDGNVGFFFSAVLPPDESPETLVIDCTVIAATSYEEYATQKAEMGSLRFAIKKTGATTVREFPLDIVFNGTRLDHIKISHSPVELSIQMTGVGKPEVMFSYPQLIGENGRLLLASDPGMRADDDWNCTFTGAWETGGVMPERLTIWQKDSKTALVIDTETGEATLHPAETIADDQQPQSIRVVVDYEKTV